MDGPKAGGGLRPGLSIGRYELVVLVRGGEASAASAANEGDKTEVWLARERTTARAERLVALTFAPESLAGDDRFRDLLRQEVKLAAALAHPNVAQVLELGIESSRLFVVSEWVEGETLAELRAAVERKKKTIPPAILLRILADACGGLHAAHLLRDGTGNLLNVVHADVSARTIVIGTTGGSRVVDLGFAKARARLRGGANVSWLEGKGDPKPPPPPPGQRIDRHADVWGVGAILSQTLARDVSGAALPDGTGPNLPSLVTELILRARSIDPAERFATAAEMQGAIEAAMVTLGMPTPRASVAAFMKEHLGERMAARAAALLAARAEGVPPVASLRRVPDLEPTPASTPAASAPVSVPLLASSLASSVPSVPRLVKPTHGLVVPTPGAESVRGVARTAPAFRIPGPAGTTSSSGSSGSSALRPRGTNPALFAAGFLLAVVGSGTLGYVGMRARDRADAASVAAAAPQLVAAPPPPVSLPAPAASSCPAGMTQTGAALCLDTSPVTTEAYKACSDSGDCKRAATENRWPGITPHDQAAYDPLCRERDPKVHAQEPINCVDRDMAAVYCKTRGARLPSDAELAAAPNGPAGTFSEWGFHADEVPANRSYAIGFRCAQTLLEGAPR